MKPMTRETMQLTTSERWKRHIVQWKDCKLCDLCHQRNKVVFARGTIPCDVLYIGEAPGLSEDAIGQPFVGPAGHLLDQIVKNVCAQLGKSLPSAFTNLVGCFPAEAKREGTNEPTKQQIKACQPKLLEIIKICKPRLIVLVGKLAKQHTPTPCQLSDDIKQTDDSRPSWIPADKFLEYVEIDHPAYILRLPLAHKDMAIRRVELRLAEGIQRIL